MRNISNGCHMESINKEIVEQLNTLQFVQKPNFNNYDYVTISENFIELIQDEVCEPVVINENIEYHTTQQRQVRQFTNKNFDGIYVEC